ncbi:MAG: sugar ABC transporter substrate-binding protein [Eubacteriales bacterium]|nr:sugar ABC transporter substrate-binding protein [Eubacteriales bacterium]
MKKRVAGILTSAVMAASLLCGSVFAEEGGYVTPTAETELDGSGLVIGCILANVENSIYANMKNDMEEQSKVWGNEFMFVAAMEAPEQVEAIESLVNAGCNAIIVHIANAEAEEDAIKAATEQGVKVLAFDQVSESAVKSYIADNYNAGYNTGVMAGEWINEKLGGEAKLGLFTYTKMAELIKREEGIRAGLADTAPDAEIVISSEDYTISMGVSGAENFLQAEPDLDGIVSFNGSAALGAYQAFQAAGIDDENHAIFATDGAPEELDAIAEGGCYRGTTSMGFDKLGFEMLGDAILACQDQPIGEEVELWPVESVNADNVEEYR